MGRNSDTRFIIIRIEEILALDQARWRRIITNKTSREKMDYK